MRTAVTRKRVKSPLALQPDHFLTNLYKEGENPPPECPMHKKEEVQLEMDFKEKQRSLTDLNWDGHEERD